MKILKIHFFCSASKSVESGGSEVGCIFQFCGTYLVVFVTLFKNIPSPAFQLWNLIETQGFREDIKEFVTNSVHGYDNKNYDKDEENNNDNNKNKNNDKGISALGLDRDLRFSQGHQGHYHVTITILSLPSPPY